MRRLWYLDLLMLVAVAAVGATESTDSCGDLATKCEWSLLVTCDDSDVISSSRYLGHQLQQPLGRLVALRRAD